MLIINLERINKRGKKCTKIVKKNLISSEILTWKKNQKKYSILLARINRYELIFKKCDKFNIKNILLGHHQDDLFENFFIRMLKREVD